MKKIASTIFLFFYAASIVGTTVERTEVWASEHVHHFKHFDSGHTPHVAQGHKHSPHAINTRVVEDGSVLVSPFVRSSHPPSLATALHQVLTGFDAEWNSGAISSRAPPTLL